MFLCSGAGKSRSAAALEGSTERPWVCVPTPAGQCCGPSPWRFSTCTSWVWEMCPRSWRGHPWISSVPGALQPPLEADKWVWVRPPPLSPVLAPRCFHPPHQGGQGAPWGLRQHLTRTPTPGTSPAHPRAEGSLPNLGLGRAADLCPLSGAGDESPALRGCLRCCLEQRLLSRHQQGQGPVPTASGTSCQGCGCEAGDG